MSRTQIPGIQIADHSITDVDVSDTAAIGNHKINYPTDTKTADYTVQSQDYIIFASAAIANVNITLPSAVGLEGKQYIIKKVDTTRNEVVVLTVNSETIDNESSLVIKTPMASLYVVSDNINWWII
jgi:hypothetical protein